MVTENVPHPSVRIHLRVVDLPYLKQRFKGCFFKLHFTLTIFYHLHLFDISFFQSIISVSYTLKLMLEAS